jgi:hypothetical protein
MKTAMQELIDWTNQYEGKMISADQVVLKAHKLLEKEKEHIINDYNNGFYKKTLYLTSDDLEEYYNQTYNQQKVTINETKRHIEEIGKLMYYKDTTTGLWATDRLDLVPDEIKHLFFKLK